MHIKHGVWLLAVVIVVLAVVATDRILRLTRELHDLQETFQTITNAPPATARPAPTPKPTTP